MIVDYLDKPQKKVINIFFHKNQKLNKKYIRGNLSYMKIGKKINLLNKNIIFSFNKLSQIKKFNIEFKFLKSEKYSIYYVFNSFKSKKINKILVLIFLLFIKKKEVIFFYKNYQNSFLPDLLYNIKFRSLIKTLIYFSYQFLKNLFSIFASSIILIKVK